ncbi:hypothetical protein EWM62_12930 [Mucilaginibacter terrigena]|uniref:Class III cytochrome C domain-containing protein n=1 Tax=Mucilaginibacter terrigena TaxID=2492395 RepID=A0A4V1ZBK4_9SPHI|nr:hypothetical protein [Mucilaginibacter terrigena]RYU89237.1 hypothetical protein EWM62_12930 [Mucilaginibacter terrigena]
MKKSKYHIFCAWALLFCFVAGQYMVYAHQHPIIKAAHEANCHDCHNTAKQTLAEKCQLCDAMHHNSMELASHTNYSLLSATDHVFVTFEYNFKSIALILSQGRAPPVIS